MAETIKTETKNGVTVLTINRPDKMNALNMLVLTEIRDAVREMAAAGDTRVLIVTGAGEKAFVAGADIKQMAEFNTREAENFARLGHEALNAIYRADIVSIAAINGFALGGGLELALACDIRLAVPAAKMGLPEVGLGLIPGFGGTQRLARLIGTGHALEIILTANMIDAQRALSIGLVNHLCEPGELMERAQKMAERILAQGPSARNTARWLVHSGLDLPLAAGLEREITSFAELFTNKEHEEGMNAFIEKRKPNFG